MPAPPCARVVASKFVVPTARLSLRPVPVVGNYPGRCQLNWARADVPGSPPAQPRHGPRSRLDAKRGRDGRCGIHGIAVPRDALVHRHWEGFELLILQHGGCLLYTSDAADDLLCV